MKKSVCILAIAAGFVAFAPLAASAQVVTSKKTCIRAVADAKEASADADVSQKIKDEVADLIRISEHLCTQANFVYAERLLAIARGLTAQEQRNRRFGPTFPLFCQCLPGGGPLCACIDPCKASRL